MSDRVNNTVLLGALSLRMHLEESLWLAALHKMVPEKFLSENLAAFNSAARVDLSTKGSVDDLE